MRWLQSRLGCLFILLLGAFVGCAVGLFFGYAFLKGALSHWEHIPLPNGQKADHFETEGELLLRTDEVYVVTRQGELFARRFDYFGIESDWQEVEQPNFHKKYNVGYCYLVAPGKHNPMSRHGHFWIRRPRGVVVQQLDCEYLYDVIFAVYRYVVLQDGELWRWMMSGGFYMGLFTLFLSGLLFAVGGSLLGLWLRRRVLSGAA